ncbi:MAG: lipocalin-like domain-containing protein [Nitrospiraceae bacterium]
MKVIARVRSITHHGTQLLGGCLFSIIGTLLPVIDPSAESVDQLVRASRQAAPGYTYHFPRDHGSHDEFHTEWWYYTGHLTAENGRQFGYELTFFRRGIDHESVRANPSRWAIRHLYLAHFALSDHGSGAFRYAEKISRGGLGKAGAEPELLRVWIDRWIAESPALQPRHHLKASTDEFSLDLNLTPQKPPIVHGQDGVSRKGKEFGQASHYYSMTRLSTAGTLMVEGDRLPVTGTSWMDHEFGSGRLGDDQVGWDWFSLQLTNQTEIMLYLLRRRDGTVDPASSGTLVLPDGRSQHLPLSDVRIDVLEHWESPSSRARYPNRWRIAIPRADLLLEVIPRQRNQELITQKSTRVTYWEGAVTITGRMGSPPISGEGYVELTGYAEPFSQP